MRHEEQMKLLDLLVGIKDEATGRCPCCGDGDYLHEEDCELADAIDIAVDLEKYRMYRVCWYELLYKELPWGGFAWMTQCCERWHHTEPGAVQIAMDVGNTRAAFAIARLGMDHPMLGVVGNYYDGLEVTEARLV